VAHVRQSGERCGVFHWSHFRAEKPSEIGYVLVTAFLFVTTRARAGAGPIIVALRSFAGLGNTPSRSNMKLVSQSWFE
jgi:hypothetical protein